MENSEEGTKQTRSLRLLFSGSKGRRVDNDGELYY